jgi:hypothetical protein
VCRIGYTTWGSSSSSWDIPSSTYRFSKWLLRLLTWPISPRLRVPTTNMRGCGKNVAVQAPVAVPPPHMECVRRFGVYIARTQE